MCERETVNLHIEKNQKSFEIVFTDQFRAYILERKERMTQEQKNLVAMKNEKRIHHHFMNVFFISVNVFNVSDKKVKLLKGVLGYLALFTKHLQNDIRKCPLHSFLQLF